MKRTIFSLLAVAGLIFGGAACERHSASELAEGHEAQSEEAAKKEESTPHAPEAVPTNPAGSAPVSAQPKPEKEAESKPGAAPKFFSESK